MLGDLYSSVVTRLGPGGWLLLETQESQHNDRLLSLEELLLVSFATATTGVCCRTPLTLTSLLPTVPLVQITKARALPMPDGDIYGQAHAQAVK